MNAYDEEQQLSLPQQQQQQEEEDDESEGIIYDNNTVLRQPSYYRSVPVHDDNNEQIIMTPSLTTVTYSDLVQRNMGLPSYTMGQVIDAANTFTAQYAIVVYDPSRDVFIGYYSQNHQWVTSGATMKKLRSTITALCWLLRKLFPERFTPDSPEFVLALSGGDYPLLRDHDCIRRVRVNIMDKRSSSRSSSSSNSGPCEEQQQQLGKGRGMTFKYKAPILHFGSVFAQPLFPNVIAMPMPGVHLNCFEQWFTSRKICPHFLPSYMKPGGLVFGEEIGLEWDDLVPQLIWRGTDFPFLANQNDLEQPTFERYVERVIRYRNEDDVDLNEVATAILRENYHKLVPRWKGVVLTAESEIEARQTNTMPKVDIKFSHVAGDGGKKRLAKGCPEYQDWERINFPVAGEQLSLRDLAKYKYHIDLGGGGGTSWSGFHEKLAFPGLLFHHVTATKDYIHDLLEPWVHYVPVKSDLSDLMVKLEWAEKHPNYSRQISDNASKFMRELGTQEGFERVFQSNMVKPLQRVIEAYTPLDPTNKRHHGKFRQALTKNVGFNWRKPFIKCTGETRFSCKLLGSWV